MSVWGLGFRGDGLGEAAAGTPKTSLHPWGHMALISRGPLYYTMNLYMVIYEP